MCCATEIKFKAFGLYDASARKLATATLRSCAGRTALRCCERGHEQGPELFLYMLTIPLSGHIPVGSLTKAEVRAIARRHVCRG